MLLFGLLSLVQQFEFQSFANNKKKKGNSLSFAESMDVGSTTRSVYVCVCKDLY